MELAEKMVIIMRENNLVSLSAPQIGYPFRVICVDGYPAEVFFNPIPTQFFEPHSYQMESCGCFPGYEVKIKRPEILEMRFSTPDGFMVTKKYVGVSARRIQHSLDHLEGYDFRDRAIPYHRQQAKKKAQKT